MDLELDELNDQTDLRTLSREELGKVMAQAKKMGDYHAELSGKWYGRFQAAARCMHLHNSKPSLDPANVTAANGSQFVADVMRGYGIGVKDSTKELR